MRPRIKLALSSGLAVSALFFGAYKFTDIHSQLGFKTPLNEAKALPTPPPTLQLTDFSSTYAMRSWYLMQLGNVPVGVVSVGVDDTKSGLPLEYYAQFVTRVGVSTFDSLVHGALENSPAHVLTQTQSLTSHSEGQLILQKDSKWTQEGNNLIAKTSTDATLQGMFPLQFSAPDFSVVSTPQYSNFYFKAERIEKAENIYIPFLGLSASAEKLHIKYDSDNFLLSASVPLAPNVSLDFKKIPRHDYLNYLKTIPETQLDFGWLAALKSTDQDVENLTEDLGQCVSQADSLNRVVLKKMSQSSYISYRKLINVARFCQDLKLALTKNKGTSSFERLNALAFQMKKIGKEDRLEMPYTMTDSPDLTVFYNDTLSFMWPKIITRLIFNSLQEIKDNIDLEKNRKSLLNIQVNIASLQPRAVVRADIKLLEPAVTFVLENSSQSKMMPTSLANLLGIATPKQSPYFINGQFFAANSDFNLNNICEKNTGTVGIDLGDAPAVIINSGGIRGSWDALTRAQVAREFAMKATLAKSCQRIVFRMPEGLNPAIKIAIEEFKNSVISADNEILLSNNVQKKLLVMPGKYRITTTSLVTGDMIASHEFNVEPGTNTIVNAKAN